MFTPKFGLSNLTVKSEGGGLQRVHCIYIPNPQLSHSTISLGLFFSVTVDGRNLIFGHKHHIGIPYCG
jgi:hypothetical protein